MSREYFKVHEISAMTGMSAKSVYRAIERGDLEAVEFTGQRGLFVPVAAFEAWKRPVVPISHARERAPTPVASRRPPARGSREALRALERERRAS